MMWLKKVRFTYRFMELIIGIIYILLSLVAMRNLKFEFVFTIQLFGIFSIIKGAFEILNYANIKKRVSKFSESVLVIGGLDILIGLNLLIFTELNVSTLSILFGLWFLLNTLLNMSTSLIIKPISYGLWLVAMIIYSFCIVIAFLLVFQINAWGWTVTSEVGTYFLLFGSVKIISGIINERDIHTLPNS